MILCRFLTASYIIVQNLLLVSPHPPNCFIIMYASLWFIFKASSKICRSTPSCSMCNPPEALLSEPWHKDIYQTSSDLHTWLHSLISFLMQLLLSIFFCMLPARTMHLEQRKHLLQLLCSTGCSSRSTESKCDTPCFILTQKFSSRQYYQ